jgi:hypothetical protein
VPHQKLHCGARSLSLFIGLELQMQEWRLVSILDIEASADAASVQQMGVHHLTDGPWPARHLLPPSAVPPD